MSKAFSCKLNKKYRDALKWKPNPSKATTDKTVAKHFGGTSIGIIAQSYGITTERLHEMYHEDMDSWEDEEDGYNESEMSCCGLDELNVGCKIDKDTPKNRYKLARKINQLFNDDNRVFITGLPVSKSIPGATDYNFKNYRVIRRILMDFGMKQVTPRTYINANSKNRLSVLVGQF